MIEDSVLYSVIIYAVKRVQNLFEQKNNLGGLLFRWFRVSLFLPSRQIHVQKQQLDPYSEVFTVGFVDMYIFYIDASLTPQYNKAKLDRIWKKGFVR